MTALTQAQQNSNQRLKPLILLSDSQLLFYKENQKPYIRRILQLFEPNQVLRAAYIGASNNDEPEFYQIFQGAMETIGITQCMHITQQLTQQQLNFLANAHVILLSGGSIWQGWQTIKAIEPILAAAKTNGSVIIGVSAGAAQLGILGWRDKQYLSNTDLFGTLGYIPAMFSPHDENNQWQTLKQMIVKTAGSIPGIGIPAGAGVVITPDNHIQAVRKPAVSFSVNKDKIVQQPAWKIQL